MTKKLKSLIANDSGLAFTKSAYLSHERLLSMFMLGVVRNVYVFLIFLLYKMELNNRISIISSNGSSTTSDLFQQDFSGKELLLLLRLQTDPELFESWKANVISGDRDENYSLAVSLHSENRKASAYETV